MSEVKVTQTEPWIYVTISGANDEPMRENERQSEAGRAAKKHLGAQVSLISSGGANGPEGWELHYSYVPATYVFPPRTD